MNNRINKTIKLIGGSLGERKPYRSKGNWPPVPTPPPPDEDESKESVEADVSPAQANSSIESRAARKAAYAASPESIVRNREALSSLLNYQMYQNALQLMKHVKLKGETVYWPALPVLVTLFCMFRITNQRGYPEFIDPGRFTPTDQRITGLKEIQTVTKSIYGLAVSEDQIKRALKALHDVKFLHKTHGRVNDRGVCYIRLMGGRMKAALEGKLDGPDGLAPLSKMEFPLVQEGEYSDPNTLFTPNPLREQNCAPSYYSSYDTASEDHSEPTVQPSEKASVDGTSVRENGHYVDPLKRVRQSENSPRKEKLPKGFNNLTEGRAVLFSLTHQQQKIIDFIQTRMLFVDATKRHAQIPLSAKQVAKIVKTVESGKLTLAFLREYEILLERFGGYYVWKRMKEDWWAYLTVDHFCQKITTVKKAIRKHLASLQTCEAQLTTEIDLDEIYDLWIHFLKVQSPTILKQASPEKLEIFLCGTWINEHEPEKAAHSVILTDLLKNQHDPALLEKIREFNRPTALKYFKSKPEVYYALQKHGHDMKVLLGLEDETVFKTAFDKLKVKYVGLVRYRAHVLRLPLHPQKEPIKAY